MEANRNLGLLSAVAILFIWSGFFVMSRAGVQTNLTPWDIAALRFIVAGIVTLPFIYRWWPRKIGWTPMLVAMLTGPGILYSMCMFLGVAEASVAMAGVFSNGAMPIFTGILVASFSGLLPNRIQTVAIALLVTGAIIVGFAGQEATEGNSAKGIAFFLAASALVSTYTFSLKHFDIAPTTALAIVNVPNAVFFLPIWWFFLPSGMADTDTRTVIIQGLFHGFGPGFAAVFLYAMAARHLGASATAGFSSAVPAFATVLAIPVVGEIPGPAEWIGITIVTVGLVLVLRK